MSQESHDAHHDPAEENKKALVIAILIITALGTAIAIFLVRAVPVHAGQGHAVRSAHVKQKPALRASDIPTRSRRELVRGADNRDRTNPRAEYARYLNRKLRAKGQTSVIRSRGKLARTLEVSWTRKTLDMEHMEQLKQSQGFYAILRDKGFTNLVLKIDDKIVWRKQLQ